MKKYAVITGASSGIGTEFAKRLSKEGYSLILVARRRERLEELANTLEVEALIISADLSDISECRRVIQELNNKEIEIFINNAGFGLCEETLNLNTEYELNMIDLNVKAMHLLAKLILDKMVQKNRGYILNVASSAGLLPAGPYMSTYYATKAYVASYTRGVAEELRRRNSDVYFGCLCPGPVDTEFNKVANVKFALKGISAYDCANYAVTHMFRRKITIVPTVKMKLLVIFGRLVPMKFYVRMIAKQQLKKIRKGSKGE